MKLYKIYCATGCTCCSSDNHYRGYFKSQEDAERRIVFFKLPEANNNPVASQYARKGRYEISGIEAEVGNHKEKEILLLMNGSWIYASEIKIPKADGSLDEDDRIF